jgi:hypothetical protein
MFQLGVGAMSSTERVVIVAGDSVWHAVYRFDGPGFACWDFFSAERNPEVYQERVSDRLLTTQEVTGRIRRMRV